MRPVPHTSPTKSTTPLKKHILSCAAFAAGLSASAQIPMMIHGQKVLVDKHGQIVQQAPLAHPLPQAPLVGGADSCVTPDVIVGAGPFAFDTTTATTGTQGQSETICNFSAQVGVNRDVWFTWTSGFTGQADISFCNMATFDTKVAVYAGTTCPTAGSALACNDDACGLQSRTQFSVTSGSTYVIQVGEWGTGAPSPGTFTINPYVPPVPPTNDNCTAPIAITGPGTYTFDNTLATSSPQQSGACPTAENDTWYNYTATSTGTATIMTCGLITSFDDDTVIAVYAGSGCPSGAELNCNDDGLNCPGLESEVTWPTTCGSSYILQVGAYDALYQIAGSFNISETGTACGSVGVPYCFGDGTGTACPCANNGAAGNGCANSVNANGANLTTSGNSSLANDTLVLQGSGMPNASCLYFQGTSQINAVFGDGLRCAGGVVTRLGTKTNVAGASQYPTAGNPSVSVKGAVTTPGTRAYQTWYRNAAAFCTTSTFNLTNGVLVTWQ